MSSFGASSTPAKRADLLPSPVLNASNCELVEIPSVVEVLHSLKALVITHNKLKTLGHVKNLAHLNTIGSSSSALPSRPSLTRLLLHSRLQQPARLSPFHPDDPPLAQEDLGGPQSSHRQRSSRPHLPLPPARGQAQRQPQARLPSSSLPHLGQEAPPWNRTEQARRWTRDCRPRQLRIRGLVRPQGAWIAGCYR